VLFLVILSLGDTITGSQDRDGTFLTVKNGGFDDIQGCAVVVIDDGDRGCCGVRDGYAYGVWDDGEEFDGFAGECQTCGAFVVSCVIFYALGMFCKF